MLCYVSLILSGPRPRGISQGVRKLARTPKINK